MKYVLLSISVGRNLVMMNHFKTLKRSNAGYEYTELIEQSKPSMWLDGNYYRFNKVMISRKLKPIVRRYK